MQALASGIVLALRAIARNGLRAGLTVLGILIGVTAVVSVTALAGGARESVANQIQAIGSNFIIVFPQNSNASGARSLQGQGQRLTEEDGKAIQRETVSVSLVAPALRARAQVVHGDRNRSTSVVGTTRAFFTIRSWGLMAGEAWSEHDELTSGKVCVLGATVKRELFGNEEAVGQMVRLGRHAYRVAGVLVAKGEAPFGGDQDDLVVMPISSMRSRVMRTAPGFAGVLMASATSADTIDRAVMQIDGVLRQRHRIQEGREPDFRIQTQKEFQEMQGKIYGLLTVLLVLVAGISLVVAGIGIMNIMLVSVTERTREIGIRMAIGARASDIRTQFLVEAVTLAVVGGVCGAAVGLLAIEVLKRLLDWPMVLSRFALVASVLVSAVTGVVFGFFPARRASLLDPMVALRRE